MSEHNLKLSEETRNRMRAKYERLKNLRPTIGLFWDSAKRGTYNVGRNIAKRAKKNGNSARTH